jgi:hypothetical protein
MKGIQVCFNKGSNPLQRKENHENAKVGWGYFKYFVLHNHRARKAMIYTKVS